MTKLLHCLRDELVRRDYAATTIRSYIQIVEATMGTCLSAGDPLVWYLRYGRIQSAERAVPTEPHTSN